MRIDRRLGLPFGLLGFAISTVAILKLVQHGFGDEFVAIFVDILNTYERALDWVLGPIEPFLRTTVDYLSALFGLQLDLQPHWKSIFTLLFLYFGSDVNIAWKNGRYAAAVFHLFLGVFVALIFAGLSGSIPLVGTESWSTALIAGLPVLGLLAYSSLGSSWNAVFDLEYQKRYLDDPNATFRGVFMIRFNRAIWRTLWLCTIIVVFSLFADVQQFQNPGLVAFLIAIVLLALYWVGMGTHRAIIDIRIKGTSALKAFSNSSIKVGLRMLLVLLADAAAVSSNFLLR